MALNPGEFRSGGQVRDTEGRRVLKSVAGGAPLNPGEYKSGGRVFDSDGREVINTGGGAGQVWPAYYEILPLGPASLATNWPQNLGENTSQALNVYRTSSGAQNAEIGWDVLMDAGTWTIGVLGTKDTDLGIYTALIDGVVVGVVGDGYAAARAYNNAMSLAGVVIAAAGRKRVSLKMATKNAASSNYFGQITQVTLVKTA